MTQTPIPEYELRANGLPDHQRNLITAARCVVAAATEPETPFSIEGIAKRTGLSQSVVREALSSEEFRELVEKSTMQRCSAALAKGIGVAEGIMLNSGDPKHQLAAFRTLIGVYKTLVEVTPRHDSLAGEQVIMSMLQELERTKEASTQAKTVNASESAPNPNSGP